MNQVITKSKAIKQFNNKILKNLYNFPHFCYLLEENILENVDVKAKMNICEYLLVLQKVHIGLNTSLLINSHIAIMTINKSKDQKTSFKEAYINLLLRRRFIFVKVFPTTSVLFKKVQVGNDQEKAQSKIHSHSKNRGRKT